MLCKPFKLVKAHLLHFSTTHEILPNFYVQVQMQLWLVSLDNCLVFNLNFLYSPRLLQLGVKEGYAFNQSFVLFSSLPIRLATTTNPDPWPPIVSLLGLHEAIKTLRRMFPKYVLAGGSSILLHNVSFVSFETILTGHPGDILNPTVICSHNW